CVGELDPRQSLEVDRGEGGPDNLARGGDVGDDCGSTGERPYGACDNRGRAARCVQEVGVCTGVPGRVGEILRVGYHEAVAWRGWELVDDADVVEGNGDRCTALIGLHSEQHLVTQLQLKVVDRFSAHKHAVRCRAQPAHDVAGGSTGEVRVLQVGGV